MLVEVKIIIWQLLKQMNGFIIQHSYIDFHTKSTLFFIYPECLFISRKTASTKTKIYMNIIVVTNRKTTFSPTMSIFITEDRRHTCIKLDIDVIKISSDNRGNNYVLSFVIFPLQPIDWSKYYLCPSNLSSYIV